MPAKHFFNGRLEALAATRTEYGRSLGDHRVAEGLTAAETGPPGPTVDAVGKMVRAGATGGVEVVTDRRAARGDRSP